MDPVVQLVDARPGAPQERQWCRDHHGAQPVPQVPVRKHAFNGPTPNWCAGLCAADD
ncbi:hypothetical protein ACTWJ9_07550 [Streptomyces sp. GDS52]|uniref:hypothetical protein n=1 Tax=Streptomyces sp. GDS52 TaxID=3406419 RepID=UPI003FD3FEA3